MKRSFFLKFRVKTKKNLCFEFVFDFLFSPPKQKNTKIVFTLTLKTFLHPVFICDKQKIYFAQIVPCRCPKIPDFAQMFETCVAIAPYSPDRYGYGHTDLINLVKSISTEKHSVSAKKLFSALKRLHTCF